MIRIGIGVSDDIERIIESILRFPHPEQVICYANPGSLHVHSPLRVKESLEPSSDLIRDLESGYLSAAVRGTLPANQVLHEIKATFQIENIERIVLLETADGKQFFLAPVGVDEGWTISQKLSLVTQGRLYAKKFGLSDKVGILSGGRLGDIGRHDVVDRTMADAELISHLGNASHYEIRIEDAISECGLIIAPDGISGNLIFRTLTFAGNGKAHGAPVMNIKKIFVDTSRVNPDYTNPLFLALSLAV